MSLVTNIRCVIYLFISIWSHSSPTASFIIFSCHYHPRSHPRKSAAVENTDRGIEGRWGVLRRRTRRGQWRSSTMYKVLRMDEAVGSRWTWRRQICRRRLSRSRHTRRRMEVAYKEEVDVKDDEVYKEEDWEGVPGGGGGILGGGWRWMWMRRMWRRRWRGRWRWDGCGVGLYQYNNKYIPTY